MVDHYVNGRRVYTLAEASDLLYDVSPTTLRQRVKRQKLQAADHINPREPVYYAEDLGLES